MTDTLYSKKDVSTAKQNVYDCRLASQLLDQLEACGFDCRERRDLCEYLTNSFTKWLTQFAPNSSPQPG